MNPIQKLFSQKKKNILSIYFTAGFPHLEDTVPVLLALQKNGADMIEIGMPYSDPLADGPVIQHSSMEALKNGMSIPRLLEQLQKHKEEFRVPLILMGYLNPVMQYGFEKFCVKARESGISGIILPDLPLSEYENGYREVLEKNELSFVFLVTPETSEERIRKIDRLSNGFIYAVSSSSITGKDKDLSAQEAYFERIRSLDLKNPALIGFGIKDRTTFNQACKYAAGAIIGTAYIREIEKTGNIAAGTRDFLNSILQE